jgi:hypothetical protein
MFRSTVIPPLPAGILRRRDVEDLATASCAHPRDSPGRAAVRTARVRARRPPRRPGHDGHRGVRRGPGCGSGWDRRVRHRGDRPMRNAEWIDLHSATGRSTAGSTMRLRSCRGGGSRAVAPPARREHRRRVDCPTPARAPRHRPPEWCSRTCTIRPALLTTLTHRLVHRRSRGRAVGRRPRLDDVAMQSTSWSRNRIPIAHGSGSMYAHRHLPVPRERGPEPTPCTTTETSTTTKITASGGRRPRHLRPRCACPAGSGPRPRPDQSTKSRSPRRDARGWHYSDQHRPDDQDQHGRESENGRSRRILERGRSKDRQASGVNATISARLASRTQSVDLPLVRRGVSPTRSR